MLMKYTRLTQPMVLEKGELRSASQYEAPDRTANGFRLVVDTHGPNAFGLFCRSMASNEVNCLTQNFPRQVIVCNNVDSCNRA
jgi:predicted molibdopterin-dependent oxidoreductase YjgC